MVDYKNYKVWQKSHDLVIDIYQITSAFPKSEQFNLVSQINRASLSVPTNIVEGCGRETQKEFIKYSLETFRQALMVNYGLKELNYYSSSSECLSTILHYDLLSL